MPSPLGHSLAGLAVWAIVRKPATVKEALSKENIGWGALCVAAANLPDADFISITSSGIRITELYHHGFTHSAGFAVIMGAVIGSWAWLRKKASGGSESYFAPNPAMAGAVTFLCVLFHALLDLLGVDTNPVNGIGLPILWPLSKEYFMFPVMAGVDRDEPFSVKTVISAVKETLLFGSILLLALWHGRKRAAMELAPAKEETGPVTE